MSPDVLERSPSAPVSADPLLRLLIGFEASQVLMAAHQLGLFKVLSGKTLPPEEICRQAGLPISSAGRLVQACVAFNLMDWNGDFLSNSAAVETYLVPGNGSYLGGLVEYYQGFYESYSRLPQAVMQNRPQVNNGLEETDVFSAMKSRPELTLHFLQAMHSLGLLEGRRLATLFAFSCVKRLLDVGGGSGALAIALAGHFSDLKISLFDQPAVCDAAEIYIKKAGFSSRIQTVRGDFWTDPLPRSADAILLSMILHDWDRQKGLELLKRCFAALPSNGTVLIYEQILNEDRCGPPVACLTNLTMLLRTASGAEYTEKDYRQLLSEAGFRAMEVYRSTGLRHLIRATKP